MRPDTIDGTPMTMQIGICCADGSLVLASDTKVRTQERMRVQNEPPETVIHHSKIVFEDRHNLAVGMAGGGIVGEDATLELAGHLQSLETIPDSLGPILRDWGNRYFRGHYPSEVRNASFPVCKMLVVNPNTEYCQLWMLRVNWESTDDCSSRCMVNGNDINPAIFWLEYLKADKRPTVEDAAGIAAITIGMAAELNPFGVGGLELHEFKDGKWRHWSQQELDSSENGFTALQDQIRRGITALGRPVTSPQV